MAKQLLTLPQLTREEMTPPTIQPVPPGVKRPRWSVMIPTYNCARFLRETLESVLSQEIDPEEMQIEVIDDCSTTDDPEAVVREFGQGRVSFYRKPANAGAITNFNTCIERSTGHYVHILHGDDFIKPGFYHSIEKHAEQHRDEIFLFIARCVVIDEHGVPNSLTPHIKELESPSSDPSCMFLSNSVRSPGCVIKRSFYEKHGGFLTSLVHTADWEMWARATALGKALFINETLAVYRFYDGNDTWRLARNGENMRDHYRLSQVMSDRHHSYPKISFLQVIAESLALQISHFQSLSDETAVAANRILLQEIKKEPLLKGTSSPLTALQKMIALILP